MGFVSAVREWTHSRQWGHNDFAALAPSDRAAIARDLGVPQDVLAQLSAAPVDAGAELPKLMAAIGLDAQDVAREQWATMRDLSVTCSTCMQVSRCRQDLQAGRSATAFQDYCPNADTLCALRQQVSARARAA